MKKIPVWKNVVLIVSTLAILIVATFAWFYNGPESSLDDFSTDVRDAAFVQISGDDGESWTEKLNMDLGVNKNFKEISGNGDSLYAPVYDVVKNVNGGFSTQIVTFEQENISEYYYEQIVDLRSNLNQNVYLAAESYVTAVDAVDGYIDGAIRVAFFEVDDNGNETLTCIWAPNSTVEYSAVTNSFTREGNVEPYYYYQKSLTPVDIAELNESNADVAKISTEGTDESGCGYNQEYLFMWSSGQNLPNDAPPVSKLDVSDEDDLFYKKLKVRVWLEGYDRECVSLLNGQKFTMSLQFIARKGE